MCPEATVGSGLLLQLEQMTRTARLNPSRVVNRAGPALHTAARGTSVLRLLPRSLAAELRTRRSENASRAKLDESALLPAAERYTGTLYQAAGDALDVLASSGAGLLIISGGYDRGNQPGPASSSRLDEFRRDRYADHEAQVNHRADVRRIAALLSDPARSEHPRAFPADSIAAANAGLYSWWADAEVQELFPWAGGIPVGRFLSKISATRYWRTMTVRSSPRARLSADSPKTRTNTIFALWVNCAR